MDKLAMINRLIGLATVGSTVASVGLLHRFLTGIANVIVLAIVSIFMLCASLVGVFYASYYVLLQYGVEPATAGIGVGLAALALTIILISITIMQFRKLREMPKREIPQHKAIPGMPDLGGIVNAFVQGFLHPRA